MNQALRVRAVVAQFGDLLGMGNLPGRGVVVTGERRALCAFLHEKILAVHGHVPRRVQLIATRPHSFGCDDIIVSFSQTVLVDLMNNGT